MTTDQFKQLILPLKNRLFRFALSFIHNEDEAKDIVQDVMIKIWEEVKDPGEIRNLEAWCIKMTRNKAIDKLKKSGRHYLQIADRYDMMTDDSNPHRQMEDKDSASYITKLISLLPVKQKVVITLRDINGYSYKEIAEMMELEMNHVKVLLHRARTTIKNQLIKINSHGTTHPQ